MQLNLNEKLYPFFEVDAGRYEAILDLIDDDQVELRHAGDVGESAGDSTVKVSFSGELIGNVGDTLVFDDSGLVVEVIEVASLESRSATTDLLKAGQITSGAAEKKADTVSTTTTPDRRPESRGFLK